MRRILLLLALLTALLPPPTAQAVPGTSAAPLAAGSVTNLVRNPGWETGPHPWFLMNSAIVTEGARTGSTAAKITGGEGTLEQTITDLLPNTTYTLSGHLRVDGQGAWIGVKRYGGTESNVRITSQTYTRGEVTFTTGAENTSAVIYFFKNDIGNTAYGDDFQLIPTATLGRQHAVNPGWESGGDSWLLINSRVVDNNVRTGARAAQISGGEGTFEQTVRGLSANTTYVLRGWAKVDSQEAWIGVKGYGGTEANQKVTSTTYSQANVTFTTGPTNTTAVIYFFKYSQGNTAYGDDLTVTPLEPTLPQVWTEHALTSVFPGSGKSASAGTGVSLLAARNEYESGQVVLRSKSAFTVDSVQLPDLVNGTSRIPAANLRYKFVGNIRLPHNSSNVTGTVAPAPGFFPEYLFNDRSRTVLGNTSQSISVTVNVPKENTPAGIYRGNAQVVTDAGTLTVPLQVEVANVTLPDANAGTLNYSNYTNVFGFEGTPNDVERIYNLPKYSAKWWTLMEEFAADMKEGRNNTQWIPTLDLLKDGGSTVHADGRIDFKWERFDQVVEFLLSKGVAKRLLSECFMLKPNDNYEVWALRNVNGATKLGTVSYDTAEGRNFTEKYLDALREHLKAKGWYDKWSMTLGDEPWTPQQLSTMRRVYDEQLKVRMPGVKMSSPHAVSTEDNRATYQGRLGIHVPLLNVYEDNRAYYQDRKAEGAEIWTYVCVQPQGAYYNRFIDLPQARLRLMNWYNFQQGVTGTLHWAYDNWHEPQTLIQTPGDVHIVYPDPENGKIMGSVRDDTQRDSNEDFELLSILAKRDPAGAHSIATSLAPTAKYQPVDPATFAAKRAQLVRAAAG